MEFNQQRPDEGPQHHYQHMNKQQTAKANSHQAIAGIFASNPEAVSSIPALDLAVEAFTDEMLGIDANLTVQTSPSGASAAKQAALIQLIDCAEQTAGAVHSLAEATKDVELGEQVDFSRSVLIEGSGASIVARCRGIYDLAKVKLPLLGDHGVTQPKLTAFNQAIKTYDTLRSTPRQAKAAQSAATKQLARAFPKVERILAGRIDRLMVQFKSSNPEFYDKYQTARSIVSAGARAEKAPEKKAA